MGKHFGPSGSTIVAGVGKTLCGLILGLIVCSEDVGAATYFISPTGADSNRGTAITSPWETFPYAMSHTVCGDTVILMNGTYTLAAHGPFEVAKSCTASTVFTVQAQNERAALIRGDGTGPTFMVIHSAYIVLDGLRAKSADNPVGSNDSRPMTVRNSNNITIKKGLFYENNRYFNVGLMSFYDSHHILVEDTEMYSYHRHASGTYQTPFVTYRRVYCNSRSRADLPGAQPSPTGGTKGIPFASSTTSQGEACVAIYPSNDNILENVIVENSSEVAEVNASGTNQGRRNKMLGNIGLGTRVEGTTILVGYNINARGATTSLQPQDNLVDHNVLIKLGGAGSVNGVGVYSLAALNTQVNNTTIINPGLYGVWARNNGASTGGGFQTFFSTNLLVIGADQSGVNVNTTDTDAWTVTNANVYQSGGANNIPSSHANYNPSDKPSAVDPQMGTCYLWAPDGSAAATNNWGARILYRYNNGKLTNVPLWNPTTGEFPHGAIVAGVNDVAGQSLFDVHKRLNVNTNGCSFPANYGAGGTDVDAPSTPMNLNVF